MKLFSYVVRYDTGFAPNPFGKYCTLACCKPKIRKVAQVGDWVMGTGSVENVGNNKLVYAMRITENPMPFYEYSKDRRFKYKIPRKGQKEERGDNIYYYKEGKIKQRKSYHSKEYTDYYQKYMARDLNYSHNLIDPPQVLISDDFIYLGRGAKSIPKKFSILIKKGPGHKCINDPNIISEFLVWVKKIQGNSNKKRKGNPYDFEENLQNLFKC